MRRRSPTLFAHTTGTRARPLGSGRSRAAAHRVAARDRARVDARLATRMATDGPRARATTRHAPRATPDAADSDDEFFGPGATPSENAPTTTASAHDSAGSDEGANGDGERNANGDGPKRAMTRAEKMKEAIRKAKEAAKAGIVNVPRGSVARAKHGLAMKPEELREREEADTMRRLDELKVAKAATMAAAAAKQKETAFDTTRLEDFLDHGDESEADWNAADSDDDDNNAAAIVKYGDDDETRSLFVMHPTTKLRRYWDFLQIFLLLYIAISVPYRIGFSEPSYGIWYVVDFLVDIYFYIDMFFNFFTAYWETSADDDDFHYVTNLWKIQKHYLKGWFLPDAISLLPIDYVSRSIDGTLACSWESEAACGAAAANSKVPEVLRLFKMLRLLRVMRTGRILERYQESLMRVYKIVTLGRLLALLVLLSHWMACAYAYVYNFEREDASGVESHKSEMYVAALFWSVQTLTTVGYGNVVPTTVDERIIAILVMITGGFVFSAIISGVNMSMDEDSPGNRFAVLMNHVRELLSEHKMPSGLKSRVRSHYKASAKPQKLVNRDIIQPLPEAIRADVNFYIYGKAMSIGLRASGTVRPQGIIVEILCRTMDTHMYARGARICYPYELADKLIITLHGRISYSPDEATGFYHSGVQKIKRKRLREQQIELAEEKGLLRGPGTVLNPGLLSGFYKGMLCAMPFDKHVEALVMDHSVFYDMCAQHQPTLLRNFEDEFLNSLQALNKPKMARIALSECDMRRFLEETTRNVCSNWRELLENDRAQEDAKRLAREQAGAIGTVTAGGFKDMNVPNAGTTPGATIGAIKLAMQQMHADIVNISEQIAQVMIAVKEVQVVGQDTASNVSHIIISNDTIEEKQLNMELNVEAVYQSLQQIATNGLSMEAGGWHGGGGKQVFDFRKSGSQSGGGGGGIDASQFSALQSDAIREKIEQAAKRGTKLSVTTHIDNEEEVWERERRRPTVGIQGIRRIDPDKARARGAETRRADDLLRDAL